MKVYVFIKGRKCCLRLLWEVGGAIRRETRKVHHVRYWGPVDLNIALPKKQQQCFCEGMLGRGGSSVSSFPQVVLR